MRLAIDTNCYRDFCEGDDSALKLLQTADQIFMPLPVLAELRAGFACGTLAAANERTLNRFLDSPRVAILLPDEQTSFHYGRLYAQLRTQGTPVPTNDLWIAALVVHSIASPSTRATSTFSTCHRSRWPEPPSLMGRNLSKLGSIRRCLLYRVTLFCLECLILLMRPM